MKFEPAIRIAVSKAATPAEAVLSEALALAGQLDQVDASFAGRINASKAARGEAPTRVSKAKRAELNQFAADEVELDAQLLRDFQALQDASEIVFALRMALASDLAFWKKTGLSRTHAGDVPVVQEFVDAKQALHDALSRVLDEGSTRD